MKKIKFLIFSVALFLFPLLVGKTKYMSHYIDVMTFAGIFGIVSISLCLLMGYAGQISLAHAAFMGIGAYSSGILTVHFGFSPLSALVTGMALSGVVAYIIGIPSLRLKGHYLAMASLGFGVIVHIIFNEEANLTGGPSGLVGIPPLSFGSIKLSSTIQWYYFVWFWVLFFLVLSLNLVNSRIGRAFLAIHEDERASDAMGVPTSSYKLKVFVISAVMAAFAGSLYAHYVEFINPSSFDLVWSIKFILMVMVGGMQSLWGSLFGAIFLTFLSNEWLQVFAELEMVVYGVILLIITLLFPTGLIPALSTMVQKLRRGL